MNSATIQRGTFLLLLALATLAFFWLLSPFFGAVLWALALAILFQPVFQWFSRRWGKPNLSALATLGLVLVIVIIPLTVVGVLLIQQILLVAGKVRSGEINFAAYFQQVLHALPSWADGLLDRAGVNDLGDLVARAQAAATAGGQVIALQALTIGRHTLDFLVSFALMLYVLFYLLRDGMGLQQKLRESLPLSRPHSHFLLNKFTTVVRATVKGNIIIAMVQGALGGLAFWVLGVQAALLWAVVMAFFALLPAVGAAIVWVPVAAYLMATGHVGKGAGLAVFATLGIGLVDNFLRPLLVGRDTQMPDYLVLMSTVGGIALFGISGFVIGPVIAAVFLACWDLFSRSNEDDSKTQTRAEARAHAHAPPSPPEES